MADYIGKVGDTSQYKLFPDGKRNKACILADNKKMQGIAFSGCLFHKILMSEGERVGIHNQCSGYPLPLFLRKL